jgi:hypothetical protein
MSAASVTKSAARVVATGSKHWPHTTPALTVSLFDLLSSLIRSIMTVAIDSIDYVSLSFGNMHSSERFANLNL